MTGEAIGIEVEEAGQPNLEGEGQESTTPQAPPDGLAVVAGWTPEEASALFSAVFNVGVLIYGPEWASHPAEFRASGAMSVGMLDKYVPKVAGGPVTTGLGLLAVAGELVGAGVRRRAIIKRGPKPIWQPQPKAGEGEAGPVGPSPATAETPSPSPPPAADNGRAYRMPPDLAKVVPPPTDDSLGGMGYRL